MALNTVSTDRLSTNVKNTNFTAAEKQDLTNDILPLASQFGQSKNLIINGAMQVAQRGTSSTSAGYGSVDRMQHIYTGTDEAPTFSQADIASGTTPYSLGFRKSIKVTNGNQTSGAGAADVVGIRYPVEAQDIAQSGWNYVSSSSFITLSFWVKSSVAQNFFGYLLSLDGTLRIYPFETGSLTANTWTKVTKIIPGNTSPTITIDNNNEEGFRIEWRAFSGTDETASGVSLDTWATFAGGTRTPDATSTWYTTNDATFELTGVQLEVGSVATDFEHRSFGQELALCQRYFFAHSGGNPGVNGSLPNTNPDTILATASCQSTSSISYNLFLPVPMRVQPTIYSTVTGSTRYRLNSAGANTNSGSDPTINTALSTHTMASGDLGGFSGLSAGQAGNVRRYQGSGILGFQAEL